MKNKLCLLSLILTFCLAIVSCKPRVPKQYIQPDIMERLLYDYHIATEMRKESAPNNNADTYKNQLLVLKKYGVSEKEFYSSLAYYTRHAEKLCEIYERVGQALDEEAAKYNGLNDRLRRNGKAYSAGDTTNVWVGSDFRLLTSYDLKPYTSSSVKADTAFHKGDKMELSFDARLINQSGVSGGIVIMAIKFGNDSVSSQLSRITSSSHYDLQLTDSKGAGIKEVKVLFMLNSKKDADNKQKPLSVMAVDNLQLLRIHRKESVKEETKGRVINNKNSVTLTRVGVNNDDRAIETIDTDIKQVKVKIEN